MTTKLPSPILPGRNNKIAESSRTRWLAIRLEKTTTSHEITWLNKNRVWCLRKGRLHHNVSRHVFHGLLDRTEHPLIDAKRTPQRPLSVSGERDVRVDGREGQLGRHVLARRGVAGVRGRTAAGRRQALLLEARGPLGALPLFAYSGGLLLGSLLLLLELSQGILQNHLGIVVGVHWLVGLRLGERRLDGGERRQGLGVGAGEAADDLVTDEGAGIEARLDADDAQDLLSDSGRARVGGNGHEARDAVGQVVDVVGRVDAAVPVPALATDQQPVALLEAMDPSRRELGRRLLLVARQLAEDGLCLLAQLLVGGLAAGGLDLLVPQQHQLLDVGPVAEAQARARQLRVVAVEARVLGRQRVRDGRLADLLAVLAEEPLDARLVRRPDRLAVGPAPQRAPLVQRQRVPLLGRRRRRQVAAVHQRVCRGGHFSGRVGRYIGFCGARPNCNRCIRWIAGFVSL
ncbi:hypothetical protein V8C44DRAFT_254159 [Trichoderma aethiopicum]